MTRKQAFVPTFQADGRRIVNGMGVFICEAEDAEHAGRLAAAFSTIEQGLQQAQVALRAVDNEVAYGGPECVGPALDAVRLARNMFR